MGQLVVTIVVVMMTVLISPRRKPLWENEKWEGISVLRPLVAMRLV
jgi:hypothetical protein